jgi:hypothetical protein
VNITRVASPTATSLRITLTVSGFIDQFEVTYEYSTYRCIDIGSPVTVYINDGSVRAYTLDNLNEDSRYTITVRAINTEGSRMASVTANTLTAGKYELRIETFQVQFCNWITFLSSKTHPQDAVSLINYAEGCKNESKVRKLSYLQLDCR